MAFATPATTAAGTDARPSFAEAARMAVVLYGEGAINVHISLFPGADGGYNMTVTFPEGLASGQWGGQPRPQAQPRPRGAQAENWRRRDPAAVPGPKTQPRRRKANVQSSVQSPPAAEPVALAPRQQEGGGNSERKRRSSSATRTARQHLKMAEVAAKTQEAGAPEAPAPTAVGELGAGSHAPPPAPAATATSPAAPSCPRLVEATLVEKQEEAKVVAALAAAARAATVPATPPPRSHGDRVLSSFGQARAGAALMGLCRVIGRAIYSSVAGRQEGAGGVGAGAGVWGRISVLFSYRR